MAIVKDLTGQRFGRLVVMECVGRTNNGNAKWLCKCDCGCEKEIGSYQLRSGRTQSCGCINRERNKELHTVHGQAKHGEVSRLYRIWAGIKTRCYNANQSDAYSKYGAKGISMCDEWRYSFEAFMKWANENGYDDSLTIDRIDPHGMYCPENCRWATQTEQQNNRSNNHCITYNGETHTVSEWNRILGFSHGVFQHRLSRGWPIERIMTTPQMW